MVKIRTHLYVYLKKYILKKLEKMKGKVTRMVQLHEVVIRIFKKVYLSCSAVILKYKF
jgi:hypothetical protein